MNRLAATITERLTAPCRTEEVAVSRPWRRLDAQALQRLNLAGVVLRFATDGNLFAFYFGNASPRA